MPGALQRALGNPLTRLLAAVSYNYYIWHGYLAVRLKDWRIPPYVSEFPQREGEMPWQRDYVLLCFAGVFALALVLTYLYEKPLSRFGRRLYSMSVSSAVNSGSVIRACLLTSVSRPLFISIKSRNLR